MPSLHRVYLCLVCIFHVLALSTQAATVSATWNSATDVPVTASSYTATGNTVNFTLNFAPATGANLTVVNNTGLPFISGPFDNLAQGQVVTLSYSGVIYPFVANYYGGTGNDLVLVWGDTRPVAWGYNTEGQLGGNSTNWSSNVPVSVVMDGTPLANHTVLALSAGSGHSLALCSDGRLFSWGYNYNGELGNNTTSNSGVPVAVSIANTALAGKLVTAISAGADHNLALCSDGTVVGWGYNAYGQLGNFNTFNSTTPTAVVVEGAPLTGKTVVAVSAGAAHSLVLCSDGTLVDWGGNSYGQLGNNTTTNSNQPVAVTTAGTPLAGKTVVSIATGDYHNIALCADGTLVTWGNNVYGQLGNSTTASSSVPVAVTTTGTALAGKTVIAVAAGSGHCLALCSDGTLAAWGFNTFGQLGNNTTTNSNVPVAVNMSGVLAGKTIVRMVAGDDHSLAQCSDGTVAVWGYNGDGQFGNNSYASSRVPVAVGTTTLAAAESYMLVASGADHVLALVAKPFPVVATLAATQVGTTTTVVNGTVNANGDTAAVSFDYGLDATYGTNVVGSPAAATGSSSTAVNATLTGLTPNTTYHFRLSVTVGAVTYEGTDQTFTTLNGNLSALTLGTGTLSPAFDPKGYSYRAAVDTTVSSITVTPTTSNSQTTVSVNGISVVSGSASSPVSLAYGDNTINVVTTWGSNGSTVAYTLIVTRGAPSYLEAVYSSGTDVPLSIYGITATGDTVNFSLNYVPVPGTVLTVVNNTGPDVIHGFFSNLAQGQVVTLTYNGGSYPFVANYYGGTGNDLVLTWAGIRLVDWGSNGYGALGSSGSNSGIPVAVASAGTPLAGRSLVALSTGFYFNLALCADGTLVSWGKNDYGQLGNNTTANSNTPAAVTMMGTPLAGKTVVAISAGQNHSLALCSDGTLAAWGYNYNGQLGNNTFTNSIVPVAVVTAGTPLAGKSILAIYAGSSDSLALCTDGTLVTWGDGNNVPVAVTTAGTPLAGRTVTALAAGGAHSLALCSDGTLVAWGANEFGQLGINNTNNSPINTSVPVAVAAGGNSALSGRTVVGIAAGGDFCLAMCADGEVLAWGYNSDGELGSNATYDGTIESLIPVTVSTSSLAPGEYFETVVTGPNSAHSLGLVVTPAFATATTLAASAVGTTTVVLNGTVNATGTSAVTSFDYGLDTSYGTNVPGTPASVTDGSSTVVSRPLTGLQPNTTYHFRVNGTNSAGTANGADMTFTTLNGTLSGLALGTGTLSPAFSPTVYNYQAAVATSVSSVAFTPTTSYSPTNVAVNGAAVDSGSASDPVPLVYGDNTINLVVTAPDHLSSVTYVVIVTRALPSQWAVAYNSGGDVPATINGFTATGGTVSLSLNYAPVPGTALMVVNNPGTAFINGTFSNMAHGQAVNLSYNGVTYPFVANYFGGTGNDLVLTWAMSRPVAWGYNGFGQLGNNTQYDSASPVAVTTTGTPLAGRTLLVLAAGWSHSLGVCADGGMVNWGQNDYGMLGNNTTTNSSVPVAVITASTPLEGKVVVAASAGYSHNLVLCSDGTLAAWGYNNEGELGNNTTDDSLLPVAVTTAGTPLAGKSVVAIGAGSMHCLALCSDGTLAAWGTNSHGELGNNTTANSSLPVAVMTVGTPLAGKTVVSMAAGDDHNLALCSDGTLVSWGQNDYGQLGNNSTTDSSVPVAVATAGTPLAGKTVIAVAAGGSYSLALCSDGTLAAWGFGNNGALGNDSFNNSSVPVAVDMSGVLAGKTIVALMAGGGYSMVRCSDGTVATWGYNGNGQLGNGQIGYGGIIGTSYPTAVSTSSFASAESFTLVTSGSSAGHTLGLVASPYPTVTTLTATSVGTTTAVLNGTVNANGGVTPVSFDYGLDSSYGANVAGTPAAATGSSSTAASAALTGLQSNTTYHFRINGTGGSLAANGADQTFTTLNGNLSGLALSTGTLSPTFSPTVYTYQAAVDTSVSSVAFTPTTSDSHATVAVNGAAVVSGSASSAVPLVYGDNTINIVITASDNISTITYTVIVTRAVPSQLTAAYSSAGDVPVTINGFTATGDTVNLSLNFTPASGTILTVVNNTGPGFINGTFSNLAQGQVVNLSYNGIAYPFVVNYYGGTGNDLVLTWAGSRLVGWGWNYYGQTGNGSRNLLTGTPLASLTPLALAAGGAHSLALFSDGSLASWGGNGSGQLGNGTTTGSSIPAAVTTAGTPLEGKAVVALSAGTSHSLALCSDGTVASWGDNSSGQLGTIGSRYSQVPVAVTTTGTALEGKSVVSIGAGDSHSLALCSDGTLATWGANDNGQLGNPNINFASFTPVAVTTAGTPLAGKTVVAIAVGEYCNIVLCSDGTLVGWGSNSGGQLGNNSYPTCNVPVLITTTGTVLAGKTVTAVAAGGSHCLALCSDGTLAAWGNNNDGQLGNNTYTSSSVPVAVSTSGVLAGKTVVSLSAGWGNSLVRCADGTLAAWGGNSNGELGSTTAGYYSNIPVVVDSTSLVGGERLMLATTGSSADHTLGLVGTPFPLPSSDATLSNLALSVGTLSNGVQNVAFDIATTFYLVMVDSTVTSMTITPTANDSHVSSITVNGQTVLSGTVSQAIAIVPGPNFITTVVTAQDGLTQQAYSLFVNSLSNVDQWRLRFFGSPSNVGSWADSADYDGDGIPNLIEYALNLNPTTPSKLPAASAVNGANFEYTYSRSTAALNAGTTYAVQWSGTLPATWSSTGVTQTVLSDDGTTQQVKAVIPMNGASSMFVHLSVTAPPEGGF